MIRLPPPHPDRFAMAQEVHARPAMRLRSPGIVSYVALLMPQADRSQEFEKIVELCQFYGVAGPASGATHFSTSMSGIDFKWERHGEFSGLTFALSLMNQEKLQFQNHALTRLPDLWLANFPGSLIATAHACIVQSEADSASIIEQAKAQFSGPNLVGSRVLQGRATVLTDFQLQNDSAIAFAVIDHGLKEHQLGQLVQRIFELEAYRILSLLALPIARRLSPRLAELETDLSELTASIASEQGDDDSLLHRLTALAAEIETTISTSQFRFGACQAYSKLVENRIHELDETRLVGLGSIAEFMSRRFDPAVATCSTVSRRLQDFSERISRTSNLLSTRVEIARERQNQSLLSSMDTRARMQLRLQQTVEGLSIAAIVYYLAGLVAYGAKGLKGLGLPINPDIFTAISIPVLALMVYGGIKTARRGYSEYVDSGRSRK